jgi:hypothetical protein
LARRLTIFGIPRNMVHGRSAARTRGVEEPLGGELLTRGQQWSPALRRARTAVGEARASGGSVPGSVIETTPERRSLSRPSASTARVSRRLIESWLEVESDDWPPSRQHGNGCSICGFCTATRCPRARPRQLQVLEASRLRLVRHF